MVEQVISGTGQAALAADLGRDGFVFVEGARMTLLTEAAGAADWDGFARSWDDLGPDRFMADGGTYRKRRFACFALTPDGLQLKPPEPHYQSLTDNPLNGGVDRVFAPVTRAAAFHPVNRALTAICGAVFEAARPSLPRPPSWHVEMHQFRIEAAGSKAGEPTPEGLHRDGVDWVLVMLVRRENIEGGVSTIADAARRPLCVATLSDPLDASLLDDRRVFHGVSSVMPRDSSRPAWRDVLVLTFRAASGSREGE